VNEVRDAMIVAGGAGSRLRPLTDTTPKPLVPFCGAPFLEGVIRRLAGAGVDRVLLIVGAHTEPFDRFADHLGTRLGISIESVPEPEPLDTAGGVRAAVERVSGPFFVLNGDILTDVDLAPVVAAHRAAEAGATLVLTRVDDTSSFGVCVREGSRIVDFVEKPAAGTLPGQDTINAGTYLLEPEVMERFPAGRLSFEREVFPRLVSEGVRIEGYVDEGVWADLGTPERLLEGHRLALDGALRWPTLEDLPLDASGIRRATQVTVAHDARLRGPVVLLPGARVGAGATVGPYVVVGPDVRIAAGALVEDSVLGAGTHVGERAQVSGLVTGPGAWVGVGARVPAGAVLGDDARIADGAQVEAEGRIPGPVATEVESAAP
jgi:mannose-1-phosphate guanylyltransferase